MATARRSAGGGHAKSTRRTGRTGQHTRPREPLFAPVTTDGRAAALHSAAGRPQGRHEPAPGASPGQHRAHVRPRPGRRAAARWGSADRRVIRSGRSVDRRSAPTGAGVDRSPARRARRHAAVRGAGAPVRARPPGRRPGRRPRRSGRGGRRRRRGVRRHGRGPAGGERRPRGRPADDVRAGGPERRCGPGGEPGAADRHPRGGAPGMSRRVSALGAASRRGLPRSAVPAAAAASPPAADGPGAQAGRRACQIVQRSLSTSGPSGSRRRSSSTRWSSPASSSSCRIERPVRAPISAR